MNVGELRKMTNQLVPDETPVKVRPKVHPLSGEIIAGQEPPMTVTGAEYEMSEDGMWTLWIDAEES